MSFMQRYRLENMSTIGPGAWTLAPHPHGDWVTYSAATASLDSNKWRPIKELTEQHVHVLVLHEGAVYTGWLDDQSGEGWCTIIYGDQRVSDRVKYWMPKPALPEENK